MQFSLPFCFCLSAGNIPGCEWVLANAEIASFVNGYLPVVGLLVLLMILPIIFEWVGEKYENRKTQSEVQQSVLQRYFYYQVSRHGVSLNAQ